MDKVSVIIPSYNRFKFLLNTIESIKNQTYKNIEIIVINDNSTQKEYYEYDWEENNVIFIHNNKNTRKIFGFVCANYNRTLGINKSNGTIIAFCDDDDIWFPKKIELQLKAMKDTDCKMSCTEGLFGMGLYNNNKSYIKYNFQKYLNDIIKIYKEKGSSLLDNGFPKIWNKEFINIHNCIVASSVIIEKEILQKYNCIINEPNGTGDDYRIWLRALDHINCVYVDDICFYYDGAHGNGQDY